MIYITKFENNEEYNSLKDLLKLPNISVSLEEHSVYYNPYIEPEESDSGSSSGSGSGSGSGSESEGGSSEPALERNKVLCKYNVTDISNPIDLYYQSSSNGSGSGSGNGDTPMFSSMEVDGVEQEITNSYTFNTTSEHTVLFTLAEGVTSISNNAFLYCSSLTSITIPDSVTSIGNYAFRYCSSLTSVTIPNSVTLIGEQAFYGCSGLTSITISDSVISIGNDAFSNCSELTSITCNATSAPTIQYGTFYGVKTGGTLTVPTGSTGYDVWMGTGDYYLGKYDWTKIEQ